MNFKSKKKRLFLLFCFINLLALKTFAQEPPFQPHVIKEGETLSSIAKENKTTVGDIMRANGMNGKSVLKVGASIKLPIAKAKEVAKSALKDSSSSKAKKADVQPKNKEAKPITITEPQKEETEEPVKYKVVKGDNLTKVSKKFKVSELKLMEWNNMINDKIFLGEVLIVNKPAIDVDRLTKDIPPPKKLIQKKTNELPEIEKPIVDKAPDLPIKQVKYKIVKGDNLYNVSKKYHVSEKQLMEWNGMPNDKIRPGQVLIVQQVVDKKEEPIKQVVPKKDTIKVNKPTATTAIQTTKEIITVETKKPIAEKEVVVKKETEVLLPKTEKLTEVKDTLSPVTAIAEPEKKFLNVSNGTKDTLESAKVTASLHQAEMVDTAISQQKLEPKVEATPIPKNSRYVKEEGFFASYFDRKRIPENPKAGDAGVFKSVSGWNDKKYYVLINEIAQGTIVRITLDRKSVCAKVMGPLPDVKQDIGYLLRMNAAAAVALGIQEDTKFPVTINY